MRISDWSSDVCSSDLGRVDPQASAAGRTEGDDGKRRLRALRLPQPVGRDRRNSYRLQDLILKALPFKGRVGWGWVFQTRPEPSTCTRRSPSTPQPYPCRGWSRAVRVPEPGTPDLAIPSIDRKSVESRTRLSVHVDSGARQYLKKNNKY